MHSTAREWTGRSKVGCGLWVCVPEGWSKAPRQGEAAAVVRLVWQRWVSSSSCVWWPGLFLPTGLLETDLRYRGNTGRQGARQK